MGEINHNTTDVFYDVPDADYRKAPGVSNSMLKVLRERWSPEFAQAALKIQRETTEALAFGKALHGVLLTPNVKATWIALPDNAPRRPSSAQLKAKKPSEETVVAIDWWKKFDADTQGLDILPVTGAYGINRLTATVKAFHAHKLASQTIADGNPEVCVFAPYTIGGTVMRKARMDFVTKGAAIVDLKTAADCSPSCVGKKDTFSWQMFDLDYDMQAAYYLDLYNDARPTDRKDAFVFVAMDWDEDTGVVGIRVLQCTDATVKSGREKYMEALIRWVECASSGNWPGYSEDVVLIDPPEFAAKKYRVF